jgi:lycopene beta-cyclase
LIVDRDDRPHGDRTWSYWSDRPTPFDSLACRTWDQLHLAGLNGELRVNLRRYRYRTIRGCDFYEHARRELSQQPTVTWLRGSVEAVEDGAEAACVIINRDKMTGRWVFDSLPRSANASAIGRYHQLQLHFKGREIETDRAAFDPSAATFLDFRMPHAEHLHGATRFFYVLPFDERHALVEYTEFSAMLLLPREYEQAIQAYLHEVVGLADYRVTRQEGGVIPITDRPYPRRLGRRVMAIGMRGGRIKPTTGFAFTRVQSDSAAIVRSLLTHDQPFDVPEDSSRYRLYDSMLLDIMEREPERIQSIFAALFKRNSIEHVLSFLDERASLAQNIQMFATLTPWPFLQALARAELARERAMRVA